MQRPYTQSRNTSPRLPDSYTETETTSPGHEDFYMEMGLPITTHTDINNSNEDIPYSKDTYSGTQKTLLEENYESLNEKTPSLNTS